MELKIDTEFRDALPPLSEEERQGLIVDIEKRGCLDPILTWNGVIVDGHNRHRICNSRGIEFTSREIDFDDRDDVLLWIYSHQTDRRNLTDGQRFNIAQKKKDILLKKGKANSYEASKLTRDNALSLNDNPLTKINTQAEIAKDLGWSTGKVAQAEVVKKSAGEDLWQDVVSGEITIGGAYNELKKKAHVSNNSGNNEWYTPSQFIESARVVMGSIDTDPASSDIANITVKAETYYTIDDNGLTQKWFGNVWMNPPYAQPAIKDFSNAVADKYKSEEIESACVLVNNATETGWFRSMLEVCSAVCFPSGRIKFIDPSGKPSGAPLQGQAIIYLGDNIEYFIAEFDKYGKVLRA